MDSDSPNSVQPAIRDGPVQEIEIIVPDINTNNDGTLAANAGTNLDTQKEEIHAIYENVTDTKYILKWVKATIAMAFSAVFALLSISFISSKGKLSPEVLFRQHPTSYIVFLMSLMVAFYSAINGVIFIDVSPNMGRACSLIGLIAVMLSFTVLLWALVPLNYGWLPWICFTYTLGVLFYRCGILASKGF